jgi:hypothetical protein
MGRPKTFDHRHTPHRVISMPPDRAAAIKRAADMQGVSSHVLIQRFISVGLTILGEAGNTEELPMPFSVVERDAFGPRDTDDDPPTCGSYNNGVGPYSSCCDRCRLRLYRIAQERSHHEYRIRDYDGRIITADWLL